MLHSSQHHRIQQHVQVGQTCRNYDAYRMASLQIQALLLTSSGNLGSGDEPVSRFSASRTIS